MRDDLTGLPGHRAKAMMFLKVIIILAAAVISVFVIRFFDSIIIIIIIPVPCLRQQGGLARTWLP